MGPWANYDELKDIKPQEARQLTTEEEETIAKYQQMRKDKIDGQQVQQQDKGKKREQKKFADDFKATTVFHGAKMGNKEARFVDAPQYLRHNSQNKNQS